MGAEPWDYFAPYEPNVQAALDKLRQTEFQAGRYRGSEMKPRTIEEALEKTGPDGTASILDMTKIADAPELGAVAPLPKKTLVDSFGTDQPTHEMIDDNRDFYLDMERGEGVYIVVYRDGKPSEIFFGGYSFD